MTKWIKMHLFWSISILLFGIIFLLCIMGSYIKIPLDFFGLCYSISIVWSFAFIARVLFNKITKRGRPNE
jgi:hypothetical protein